MQCIWRKLKGGNTGALSHLCVRPEAEQSLFAFWERYTHPSGCIWCTDWGLDTTCWRIYWSCSGTRKPPSGLPFSGFLSVLYLDSLSLLVMLVSVSVLSFVKETVLYLLCLWVSHRLRQRNLLLSKEIFTLVSRQHNDKPGGLYFLSLPSLSLFIFTFCRNT